MTENVLRLVSLFSGCGGLDRGFEDAGYQRVYANDFDPDAQAVFRLNLGEIDGRDIFMCQTVRLSCKKFFLIYKYIKRLNNLPHT